MEVNCKVDFEEEKGIRQEQKKEQHAQWHRVVKWRVVCVGPQTFRHQTLVLLLASNA